MRSYQAKRKWRDVLGSRPVLLFLFVIVLVFSWSVFGFWSKMNETSKNRQIAENKIASLRKEKENLTTQIDKLKTEAGVEESIRDKFGLVKEGEGLIIVVDENQKSGTELEANTGGFWSFFSGWFK